MKPKLSMFVHDLAGNPLVRAVPIALALQDEYEIEILGLLLSGDQVYEPYRGLFEYKTVRTSLDIPIVFSAIRRLARMCDGDIIYAFKPLLTSYGPALLASRFGRSKPLFLDSEDDEWIPFGRTPLSFLVKDLLKGWRHPTAWKYTRMLHPFTRCARGVTVISSKLQKRYGGKILYNGCDESRFDPALARLRDVSARRRQFNLSVEKKLLLFAGIPQPHKGWPTLMLALKSDAAEAWDLILAGPLDHPSFAVAKQELGNRCHLLGPVAQEMIPDLLAAVDAVPVPQDRVLFSECQVPTKLLEAMGMAKAVIASRVGDLPMVLGENRRGWLVEPGNAKALSLALQEIAARPSEAVRRGQEAREWFLANASLKAMRKTLKPLMSGCFT